MSKLYSFGYGSNSSSISLSGDISVFSDKPIRQLIFASGPQLYGDIASLANTNLADLQISLPGITGLIDNFARSTLIGVLSIYGCVNVSGSVNSLANLTKLRALDVNNLSILTNLEKLYIADQLVNSDYQMTNLIYGNIKTFANCTGLKEISIGSSLNLTGSISVFANCPNLGMLRILMSPNISGNISVLENCNIYHISISGYATAIMKITGDISVFRSKNMTNIYIHYASVYGNISSLDNQAKLKALAVNNLNGPD